METLRIVTTVTAEPAGDGVRCQPGGSYGDDWRECGRPALWVIKTTTQHFQPTPGQVRTQAMRERMMKEPKNYPYPYPRTTQRRYSTQTAYCLEHIPKKHRRHGFQLVERSRIDARA